MTPLAPLPSPSAPLFTAVPLLTLQTGRLTHRDALPEPRRPEVQDEGRLPAAVSGEDFLPASRRLASRCALTGLFLSASVWTQLWGLHPLLVGTPVPPVRAPA